ncbi:MAG TPA: bacillithiol biosynthesis cysteine-adding enzyme BshC [Polyangiales bacterium]|nr:bacillithiol biosynthesis cysteine-adding enzyme BshC [Polyangiales bacterium]
MPASIFDAYVSGAAPEFFPSAFSRERDRLNAVLRASRQIAPQVLAALEAQNVALGPSAAREENLRRLRAGAAVVVTGQQVGLFLGPLYTVYKAASAVRVARALREASGRDVVPLFWLQTEDHDLPEIAHCTVAGVGGEPRSLQLQVPEDNHVSIAHLRLPDQIAECHGLIATELGTLPEAAPHLARLARHYRAGAGWVAAFAGVLSELFEPEGLLVFDPRERSVAEHLAPLHERALSQARELADVLDARREALERAGYEAVVHVRAGAPLSFFHAGAIDGPRCRLVPGEAGFLEVGTQISHSHAQLTAALARDPLCFSSSALLRPIVQDWLLPTAAYVGGPAEVAYSAQLAPLYAAFELEMPLIVPRARLRVIEPAAARLLERLHLAPAALLQNEASLLRELAAASGGAGPSPSHFEHELTSGFERVLAAALAEIGPLGQRLGPTLDKTRDKLRTTAVKLAERYAGLRAEGDVTRVSALHRVRGLLQPRGLPQERVYAFAHFAARFGERPFLERVLAAIEPFAAESQELHW